MPALWEQCTFIAKGGAEIVNQLYAFGDKKGRPVCLVPEITGVIAGGGRYAEGISWAIGLERLLLAMHP